MDEQLTRQGTREQSNLTSAKEERGSKQIRMPRALYIGNIFPSLSTEDDDDADDDVGNSVRMFTLRVLYVLHMVRTYLLSP